MYSVVRSSVLLCATMAVEDDQPCSSMFAWRRVTLDETKTVVQLHWWLKCHGVEPPSNDKKAALIVYRQSLYCSIYL